jgi:hypothetical protein
MKTVAAILFASCVACSHAAENPAFSVRLLPLEQTMVAGTTPTFSLTIRNDSDRVCHKLIRLESREDFQQAFAGLTMTSNDEPVRVTTPICDPGVLTEEDLCDLKPGASMAVTLKHFAQTLEELEPGEYKAYVNYVPAISEIKGAFISNTVIVKVVQKNSPNKAPDSTASTGTSAAGQPRVPASAASRL